jgi:hypothetical protein
MYEYCITVLLFLKKIVALGIVVLGLFEDDGSCGYSEKTTP